MALNREKLRQELEAAKKECEERIRIHNTSDDILKFMQRMLDDSPSEIKDTIKPLNNSGIPIIEMAMAAAFMALSDKHPMAKGVAIEMLARAGNKMEPLLEGQINVDDNSKGNDR